MLVTPSGIVTLVRLEHSENALRPMLVTLFGIVTLVRFLHTQNAISPMLVTPSEIITFLIGLFFSDFEPFTESSASRIE